jgi:hypothetical protein
MNTSYTLAALLLIGAIAPKAPPVVWLTPGARVPAADFC